MTGTAAPMTRPPSGGGSSAVETYVQIQTLTATIIRSDGRRGVMTVEMGVDAPEASLATRTHQSIPRIRAACNIVVQRTGNALLPNAVPDIDRLGRELQAAVDQTLGRAGGKVLLGTVMVV